MTKKRMPSDHEIASLADKFRELWTPGEDIRTWLRKQSADMLELVHGDWSWAALAIVLTKAGITYRTGKAWTTDSLRQEATRATAPLKGYARRKIGNVELVGDEQFVQAPLTSEAVKPGASQTFPHALNNPAAIATEEEPEFKFAKLANWSGNTLPAARRLQTKEPAERLSVSDVDAVIAKFTGRKSS
jgi:hypothetical protein